MTNEEITRRNELLNFIANEAEKIKKQESQELAQQMPENFRTVVDTSFQNGWNRAVVAVLTFLNQQMK